MTSYGWLMMVQYVPKFSRASAAISGNNIQNMHPPQIALWEPCARIFRKSSATSAALYHMYQLQWQALHDLHESSCLNNEPEGTDRRKHDAVYLLIEFCLTKQTYFTYTLNLYIRQFCMSVSVDIFIDIFLSGYHGYIHVILSVSNM